MSDLPLTSVSCDGFQATPTHEGSRLTLQFAGSGDLRAVALLSDFLKQVHVEARRLDVSEVCCDLQRLTFMNSSCFKSFVVWIDTVKNSAPPYQIRFLTSSQLHWQRRSLEALRRLAASVVSIETVA